MTDPTPPVNPADPPVTVATQVKHPWRSTVRTMFAVLLASATLIPVVLNVNHWDTGAIGAQVIVVAGVITRIMATPGVDAFLQKYIPWLATKPA